MTHLVDSQGSDPARSTGGQISPIFSQLSMGTIIKEQAILNAGSLFECFFLYLFFPFVSIEIVLDHGGDNHNPSGHR